MPKVKLKKIHPDAKLPVQVDGDVGFDIFAVGRTEIPPNGRALVPTGLVLAAEPIVTGSCVHDLRSLMKVEGRSGLALKEGIWPVGGIIDPSYRGEIGVIMFNSNVRTYYVQPGQKIAQLVWYPVMANWHDYGRRVDFVFVNDADVTTRGADGFGSSGS